MCATLFSCLIYLRKRRTSNNKFNFNSVMSPLFVLRLSLLLLLLLLILYLFIDLLQRSIDPSMVLSAFYTLSVRSSLNWVRQLIGKLFSHSFFILFVQTVVCFCLFVCFLFWKFVGREMDGGIVFRLRMSSPTVADYYQARPLISADKQRRQRGRETRKETNKQR